MSSTWDFGGTDLSTFGNITMLDDSLDIPDSRGDNVTIPYRHGKTHVSKFFDERIVSFGIAVVAADSAGLDTIIDSIHALIAPRYQQYLTHTREDATSRDVLACVEKNMQVNRKGRLARIVLSFTLAEPFFRNSNPVANNSVTINASPKAMVVTNPGTVEERDPEVVLTGPLTNVVITNNTNDVILSYTGAISGGHVVTIETSSDGEYTATHSVSGNVIGNVSHSGSSSLMVLEVGTNNLSIVSSVTTTGTVRMNFYAPYLSG